MQRVILSWSGGKDSLLALETLREDPDVELAGLLTSVNQGYGRITMHGVREALLDAQAAALGLPLIKVMLPERPDNATYEARMSEAVETLKADGVDAVAFGDLFLEDVRGYRERQMKRAGMPARFPIWGRDTSELAQHFIARGHRAVVVCVDGEQLSGDFVGREFDPAFLADLPDSADPCGEYGEFHSFAFGGPLFRQPVAFRPGERILRDARFHYIDLLP